ncbi:MAG: hypothetical protein QF903_09885 [Planctomycetota bacterium]|nr:hypothetical protein [Planctomycetota bacterium]MDP6989775.1 hypothetical protein [Planctomycetota bacterium]
MRTFRLLRAVLSSSIACLCSGALAAPASAQLPEDPGPHPVGIESVDFSHPLAANSNVSARIHYPALDDGFGAPPDTANGPYPVVVFIHGWFAPPAFYRKLLDHVASYGFLVLGVGTEIGMVMRVEHVAHDAHALLYWAEEQGTDSDSFLYGMPAGGAWAAWGHSLGGAAIFHMLEYEDRVDVVALMEGKHVDVPTIATFDGTLMSLSSSHDNVAPPHNNSRVFYDEAVSAERRAFPEIVGGGHNGGLDFPFEIDPLPHFQQHRLHRRYLGGFLRAERLGEEDVYLQLFGAGSDDEPMTLEGEYSRPALWIGIGADQPHLLTTGVLGMPAERAVFAWSSRLNPGQGLDGGFGIDLGRGDVFLKREVGGSGLVETTMALPSLPPGETLFVQAECVGGVEERLTRIADALVP